MQRSEFIDRFIAYCRSQRLSPRTITTYTWALRRLPDPIPLTLEPLELALASLTHLSTESVRDTHRVWRQAYKWASVRIGIPNVMAHVKGPRKQKVFPRVFTHDELTRIWAACRTPRDFALIGFALGTGARIGEIWSLRWSKIHGGIAVIEGKTGARMVPIPADLAALMAGVGDGDHVWTGRTGPLTFPGLKIAFKRIMERARIDGPKSGPHTFRHTFATEYIRAGGDAFKLQRLLGHADIESSLIYVHLAARDLSFDFDRLSPLRLVLGNGAGAGTAASGALPRQDTPAR
ncbi:MAG: tyrosine-type recombinase/integrase [Acidobacteria bacterium]|nr:tyrosine-type recombinase/integrase [Acidobacteriota bacterium]